MNQNLQYRLTLKDLFRKTMLGAVEDTKRLDGGMNRLSGTIRSAGRILGGVFAVSTIKDFAVDVTRSMAAMQSFNNTIVAGARSEAEGANNIRFLNDTVDRLGLSLSAAQSGYKTLSGSVMGTVLQGEKANTIFRQVSEAAAVLGLSAEQTEGSFLALGQMISKGTVQAEELRGQLAERIPGAFQIGARAMGVSTEKLGDMMKDGLIKADDFLIKFGNELEKTFGNKLLTATSSTVSNINRMETAWERLKVNIGNSQSGVINSTISFLGRMTDALSQYFEKANIMSANFAAQGAKDFGFWSKALHETLGLLTGYNMGFAPIQQQENFQQEVYSKYVDKAPKSIAEAYGRKSSLHQMAVDKGKQFLSGDIDKTERERYMATIRGALKVVDQQIAGFKLNSIATKGLKGADKNTGSSPSTSIGAATEVYGNRPQNINIKVEKLAEVTINTTNLEQSTVQVREMLSKQLLEVLNDANQMSR